MTASFALDIHETLVTRPPAHAGYSPARTDRLMAYAYLLLFLATVVFLGVVGVMWLAGS